MNDWDDALSGDDGVDAWPAFVDVLAGALTFLLLGFAGLSAEHIQVEAQKRRVANEESKRVETALRSARASGDAFVTNLISTRVGIDEGTCQLAQDEAIVVCTFSDKLNFARGSWELKDKSARDIVAAFGQSLREFVSRGVVEKVFVEGHTDQLPFNRNGMSNWELSTARAGHVVRLLEESDPSKTLSSLLTASGYAEHARKHLADPRNQRVVVIKVVMRAQAEGATKLPSKPLRGEHR